MLLLLLTKYYLPIYMYNKHLQEDIERVYRSNKKKK